MNGWILGGLAVVAVGGLAWFLGAGTLAGIFRTLLGVLRDWLEQFRVWLRRPGNKTRLFCGVMALAFLTAGLQSWKRGTVIAEQRAAYALLQERRDFDVERLQEAIRGRDRVIQRFTDLAEQQQRLLEIAARQAAAALEDARAARAAAAESERAYMDAYDDRTPECEAALQQMAQACPAHGDY